MRPMLRRSHSPRRMLLALAVCASACSRSSLMDLPLWRVDTDAAGREYRVIQFPFEQASYDMETFALVRRVIDRNQDKISDQIITYEGAGGARTEETDTDFDGRVDRWDVFGPDGKRVRSATSRIGGRPDKVATYDRNGVLAQVESSTGSDGIFDLVEIYESGKLAEKRRDTDGNGRTDRVQDFRKGYLSSEKFDTNEDGVPDLEMTYARDGTLLKVTALGLTRSLPAGAATR